MHSPTYEEIREQVGRRYRRMNFFIFHAVVAVTVVTAIWLLDAGTGETPSIVTTLWAGLLVCHAVKVFMDGARDRAIDRQWQRYHGDVDEKPKRLMRLSDDGELETIEADEEDTRAPVRRM